MANYAIFSLIGDFMCEVIASLCLGEATLCVQAMVCSLRLVHEVSIMCACIGLGISISSLIRLCCGCSKSDKLVGFHGNDLGVVLPSVDYI